MPRPIRPAPGPSRGEVLLRNSAALAAIAVAVHSLWPLWAPATPRPWDGLLAGAGQLVNGAPSAVVRLAEAPLVAEPPPLVDHHFNGCDDAREAGFENIPFTDPSYREAMDGDRDGWACEPFRP